MKMVWVLLVLILSLFPAKSEPVMDYEELINLMQEKIKEIKTISFVSQFSTKCKYGDNIRPHEASTLYVLSLNTLKKSDKYLLKSSVDKNNDSSWYRINSNNTMVDVYMKDMKISYYEGNFDFYDNNIRLFVEKDVVGYFDFFGNYEENYQNPEAVISHKPILNHTFVDGKDYYQVIREFNYRGNLNSGASNSNFIFSVLIDKESLLPHSFEITKNEHNGQVDNLIQSSYLQNKIEYFDINKEYDKDFFEYKHLLDQGYQITTLDK